VSRVHLDLKMHNDNDMHIVERLANGVRRLLLSPARPVPDPEPRLHEPVGSTLDTEPVALDFVRRVLDPERQMPGLVPQPLDPVALAHGRAPRVHGPAWQRRGAL
jgi:hypothetical protein